MQLDATSARVVHALAFTLFTAAASLGCGSKASGQLAPSASASPATPAPTESVVVASTASAESSTAPAPTASALVAVDAPPPSPIAPSHSASPRSSALVELEAELEAALSAAARPEGSGRLRADMFDVQTDPLTDLDRLSRMEGGLGRPGGASGGVLAGGAPSTSGGGGLGSGGGSGRASKSLGHVSMTASVTSGTLPADVVQRIIHASLRRCYDDALKSDPALSGQVQLEFTIVTPGVVDTASAPGETTTVGLCMTKALRALVFPAPDGPCEVSVSVTLTPPGGGAAPKPAVATPSPVADPSTSVEQIHGRALDAVQAGDVAEAMRAAGCTDVEVGAKDGVTVITAKYKDAELTVTFAAAGASAVVPSEEAKRLRGSAVVVERLGMFLAIEGPRAIADSLRRAIVVYGPVK